MLEAIELLVKDGTLDEDDKVKLCQLEASGDKKIKSAFECFLVMQDFVDLADSLNLLCGHKRGSKPKPNIQNQQLPSSAPGPSINKKFNVGAPNVHDYKNTPSISTEGYLAQVPQSSSNTSGGMGLINLMKFGGGAVGASSSDLSSPQLQIPQYENSGNHLAEQQQVQRRRRQSSEDENADRQHIDENLEINDNPDESGGDTANEEEMSSIIEFQHKILSKYTLSGRIRYYDASFFHDMVSRRDYKMISIFEVFAVNRNEDDFLENLFIFKDVVNEEMMNGQIPSVNDVQSPKREDQELEENFPMLKFFTPYKEQLSFEEYHWCKHLILATNPDDEILLKKLTQIIDCFKIMKDEQDYIHSIKQLFKKTTAAKK